MCDPVSSSDQPEDDNRLLLYLMVVGFHHKKGCLVEYCYPPLEESLFSGPQESTSPDETSSCSATPVPPEDEDGPRPPPPPPSITPVRLPSIWATLPSLAIPDGAHNYDSDTVFFNLPHPADWTATTYCVACYRQMATKDLLVRTADMTRSSVQKSVVAILRLPLYGLVEYKLEIVTRAYFNERDFSRRHILEESYHNINRQLSVPSLLHSPEALAGLCVRSLITRFGSQVLVLFKLLLLERKTIFIMSPIRDLSATILTLCSLVPGLIQEGLAHSTIPFNVKATSAGNSATSAETRPKVNNLRPTTTSSCDTSEPPNGSTTKPKSPPPPSSDHPIPTPPLIDPIDPPLPEEESEEEASKRLALIFSRPHLYYGLPLQIFTCSSVLLPYFSISYFDVLVHERIRSCLAGSSNQIFKRWENDIDVFVLDNEIEIDDPQLKRILRLTSEDVTFMSYLIRAIAENSDPFSSVDIFDESQHVFYEGSDEWIRCHFKNYLLHLMRCSSLDENTREYRAFNPLFMSAWKATHNYKVWSSGPYTGACIRDIDPAHPFSGHRLNNLRFKLANLFLNRPEYLNPALNKQALSNALSSARSTVNSWFTNLGNSLSSQSKAVTGTTSTWNSFLSSATSSLTRPSNRAVESAPSRRSRPRETSPKKVAATTGSLEKDNFILYPATAVDETEIDETSV